MNTTEWAKNPQTNAPRSITEPAAPEPLGDSEGTATQVVAGLEPVHWYLENEDEYMSEKLRKEHERLNSYTFKLCKVAHPLYSAADVAKLQAENEALRVMTNPEMLDHYQALQGENESLRKEAERYRWLREKDWLTEGILKIYWSSEESENLVGVELDAAIDAAMKGE